MAVGVFCFLGTLIVSVGDRADTPGFVYALFTLGQGK